VAILGHARVSTQAQDLAPQLRQLRAAGCTEIFEEKASGTNRARPELARLLERLRGGDTLVVVRIDRLARSLSHLLSVIERVREVGGYFRFLGDPIDTAGPSGMLVLQIMGAIAQFERALIVERTKAGLAAARAQGRVGGNPALRSRTPLCWAGLPPRALKQGSLPGADAWLAIVRRLRPARSWDEVTAAVNAGLPSDYPPFTRERLVRSVRLFVRGRPRARLAEIGAALSRMGVTPRSGGSWADSSVKLLLDRARKTGLLGEEHGQRRQRPQSRNIATRQANQ